MSIRRTAIPAVTLALALALVAGTCRAGLVTFDASGTFVDGKALGGTLTIDTTVGDITSANLTVGAPDNLAFSMVGPQGMISKPSGLYSASLGDPTSPAILELFIFADTLVNYAGGPLAGLTQITGGRIDPILALQSGSLAPETNSVPEPSSLVLAGTAALAGLGAWARRWRARVASHGPLASKP